MAMEDCNYIPWLFCERLQIWRIERLDYTRGMQNWGVCVKGESIRANMQDYYRKLIEVVEVEYPGWPMKHIVLFHCKWFDTTVNVGTRVHNEYNLVEVNYRQKLQKYEPFIIALQAQQVYYCGYPSLRNDRRDWWDVSKIMPQSTIMLAESSESQTLDFFAFQEDEMEIHAIKDGTDAPETSLRDPTGDIQEIEVVNVQLDDDEDKFESQSDRSLEVEPIIDDTNETVSA